MIAQAVSSALRKGGAKKKLDSFSSSHHFRRRVLKITVGPTWLCFLFFFFSLVLPTGSHNRFFRLCGRRLAGVLFRT
jgi:hypothetical protein